MRADIITAAIVGIGAWGGLLNHARGEERAATLLAEARAVLAEGRPEKALELAGKAIEEEPDSRAAYRFRAELLESMDGHERAIADYDKLIELDPGKAELYDLRGSARFKLGRIEASITDFDKAIELAPRREREHWKRGISYYYAGRYDEGRRQFEGYQTFDDNDVENAVWRYLCMAK
ncbi:MAG: tetratricopeptide repeat protein, partial [Pirellulales bacterium]